MSEYKTIEIYKARPVGTNRRKAQGIRIFIITFVNFQLWVQNQLKVVQSLHNYYVQSSHGNY